MGCPLADLLVGLRNSGGVGGVFAPPSFRDGRDQRDGQEVGFHDEIAGETAGEVWHERSDDCVGAHDARRRGRDDSGQKQESQSERTHDFQETLLYPRKIRGLQYFTLFCRHCQDL